ncbi:hypothetical protein ACFP3Q_06300 [Nocardioides sp. GCM10027113]|uniref:hypothetical protein n=1 Tax=unclassified Nocardioides TaxID=2615069 RepID=UPI00361F33F3
MSGTSPGHRPKQKNRGGKKKPPVDPAKTGRALRQEFTTGTLTELAQRLRAARAESVPMNGPDAVGADQPHPLFEEFVTKFDDRDVQSVFDAIRHSDVAELIEQRVEAAKVKKGRETALTYRALIVGMLLTAIDGKGCLASEVAKTLYRRLNPPAMRLLDITPLPAPATATEARRQQWMVQKRVRQALHRLLSVLDPSIHPKGRAMPWVDLRTLDRHLTDEEIEERQAALSVFCNSVLQTPYDLLPTSVKRKYRGSAGMDATPLRIHARGRRVDDLNASTDPDAGYYVRTGDHAEGDDPKVKKAFYAYDINLIVAVCDHLGPNQYLPALPYVMHLDRPGIDPSGAARRMMAFLHDKGHQPRYLAGDGLYANADPDAFHTPARDIGWQLVLPILDDDLGIQTSLEGLLMVEGTWYCPSIPDKLINATKHFRAGDITLAEYQQRIAARETYRARFKGTNKSGSQRWSCAASGTHPSVICENKDKSKQNPFIGGPVLGVRLKDRAIPDPATQTNGIWPKPCRQDSVTINPTPLGTTDPDTATTEDQSRHAAARYTQDLIFGTAEHTNTYNALRQAQEGLHGFAKDDAYEALGTPGKRRIMGRAAQSVFAAFLLAAAGIRKVRVFLRNALRDSNDDLYVPRRRRKGEHATSHLPPGTKGTRGDPDYDASDPDTEETA